MKLSNMAEGLRSYGLTVVETPGWKTRGYAGQDFQEIRGSLFHHTATNRSAFVRSNAPTLNLCIYGRSDLPGPLCQIVLGRDGTVYITAAGVGNHAGVGSAPGIPKNMGNHYLIGVEAESSGVAPWDWTADQLRVAPYLFGALELLYMQHLPAEQRLLLGHKEYSSEGKIDPAGINMDNFRAKTNAAIAELRKGKAATSKPVAKKPVAKKPVVRPASTSKAPASGVHVVKKGESLSGIAAKYGTTIANLQRLNSYIKNPNFLNIGDRVRVVAAKPAPVKVGTIHVVKKGESLSGIAAKYGTTVANLQRLNSYIKNPNFLNVGDRVRVK